MEEITAEDIRHFWYTYDVSSRLSTWFSDDDYVPRHSEIRHVYSRGKDESVEDFKARCYAWEEAQYGSITVNE